MVITQEKFLRAKYIFPFIVLLLSSLNVYQKLLASIIGLIWDLGALNISSHILSILVSAIGIYAVILYYRREQRSILLFRVWLLVQLIKVVTTAQDPNTGIYIETEPFNLIQMYSLNLGLTYLREGGYLVININFLVLVLYPFLKICNAQSIVGEMFYIKVENEHIADPQGQDMPVTIKVLKNTRVDEDKKWFIIAMNKSENDGTIQLALMKIHTVNDIPMQPNGEEVELRLVYDPKLLKRNRIPSGSLPPPLTGRLFCDTKSSGLSNI
jgi:hypothetical protein